MRDAASLPTAPLPIRVSAVGKHLRGRQVLQDISFDVGAGESLAIAGVNGAGKTTLLRCLLDFSRPDAGTITIFDQPSHLPQARARLAYLPERFTPPVHMNGHEVLAWLSGLQGNPWSPRQTADAFERFQLAASAIRRPVRDYSKGMTQRLGLAAVLMANKPLLILDEPMSGLDPLARRFVSEVLAQARQAGTSLLFTTHSLNDLDRHCDRMLVVDGGRVGFLGAPLDLQRERDCPNLESAFLDCLSHSSL